MEDVSVKLDDRTGTVTCAQCSTILDTVPDRRVAMNRAPLYLAHKKVCTPQSADPDAVDL